VRWEIMKRLRLPDFLKNEELKKFLRFSIVGGTSFVINTSLQWFVRRVLLYENYISIAVVFLIVSVCHFLLNNFFAFRDNNTQYKRKIIAYLLFLAGSTLLSSALLYIFLTYIYDNVLIGSATVTAVMMMVNYVILNKFVFKQSEEPQ